MFKKSYFLLLLLLIQHVVSAQELYIGASFGGANYQGELQDKKLTLDGMTPGFGAHALYLLNDRFSFSADLFRGLLTGSDAKLDARNQTRNLQFVTDLYDLTAAGRFTLINQREIPFVPYVTGGLTVFYVNPYTSYNGEKIFLYPLSTEGQGLNAYPEIPKHRNINFAVMGGGGVEVRLTSKIKLDVEVGFRKTFTDYIDDVSTNYPNYNRLLNERGPLGVQFSYRGTDPIFPSGAQRGNPNTDDWYHVVQVRLRYSIFSWYLEDRHKNFIFRKKGWPYNW